MIQFRAHFDGKNLCPDEPVSLPEGVPLRVSVSGHNAAQEHVTVAPSETSPSPTTTRPPNCFEEIQAELGLVEGPVDWAAEHDHYLYGTPKRSHDRQD